MPTLLPRATEYVQFMMTPLLKGKIFAGGAQTSEDAEFNIRGYRYTS